MCRMIIIMALAVCVAACCPCRKAGVATAVSTISSDTTYVTHHDTVRHMIVDTLRWQPISQHHTRVMVRASHSYLSNEYCTSAASVDSLGILTHSLDTRDSARFPARIVTTERVVRDTIFRDSERNSAAVEQVVEVQRINHVTWWQRTQIVGFWAVLAVLGIKYRKVIYKVVSGWWL